MAVHQGDEGVRVAGVVEPGAAVLDMHLLRGARRLNPRRRSAPRCLTLATPQSGDRSAGAPGAQPNGMHAGRRPSAGRARPAHVPLGACRHVM